MGDTKGRFVVHQIHKDEAQYKLCRVQQCKFGSGGDPYVVTHDGRTIRFPDPDVKVHDTVMVNLETGKIQNKCKFAVGQICMIRGGKNIGRVGTIINRERHPGAHDMIHIKDVAGHSFVTVLENCMVVGEGSSAWISLPKGKGIKLTNQEDRKQRWRSKRTQWGHALRSRAWNSGTLR